MSCVFHLHHTVHWLPGHSELFDVFCSPGLSFVLWFTSCGPTHMYWSLPLFVQDPWPHISLEISVWKLSVLDITNHLTLVDIGICKYLFNCPSCITVPVQSDHENSWWGSYNFQSSFSPIPMERTSLLTTDSSHSLHPFNSLHYWILSNNLPADRNTAVSCG